MEKLIEEIFDINSPESFESVALKVFEYQYEQLPIYRNFCDRLKRGPDSVNSVDEIPFLPIEFFKQHSLISKGRQPEIIFESSGTTGSIPGKHFVADLKVYDESLIRNFEANYGDPANMAILAVLPSYLERKNASLVYMVDRLIQECVYKESGFFLRDQEKLTDRLLKLEDKKVPTLLIGVSYALLDLASKSPLSLENTIVMETGGMKGRRQELVREDLHNRLKEGFGVKQVHSEYGMTEMLSQAYSKGNGLFNCPPWLKISSRDPEDPLRLISNRTGGINVIDLANLYSCSFIATQDLGKCYPDGSFEIMGRFDTSDIRGCNLMLN